MAFVGFDPKDGEPLYDTKEAAIERAKMMKKWDNDPDAKILVHKKGIPLWFAHLVQDTWFRGLAYTELRDDEHSS
jgi:hypothetical protein